MAVNPACGFGLIPDKFIVNTKESLELTDLKNFINVINDQVYALAGQIQVDENAGGAAASIDIAACLGVSRQIKLRRAAAAPPTTTDYDNIIEQLFNYRANIIAPVAPVAPISIRQFANLRAVHQGYYVFRNSALAVPPVVAGNSGLFGKILKANDMEGLEKALEPLFVAQPPPPATGYPNDERHFKPQVGTPLNILGAALPDRGVNPWRNNAAVPAIIKNVFTWCCSRLKAPGTPNARAPTPLIPAPVNAGGVARFNVYAALANWATTYLSTPGNRSVMIGGTRSHKSTKTCYKKTNSKTASKRKSQIGGVRRKSKKVSKKVSKKTSKKASKKTSKKASKKSNKRSSKKGGAKRRGSKK